MNADRRAVICSALLRIKCRGMGTEQAIYEALSIHKAKASAWEIAQLQRDVDALLHGQRPDKPRQLEFAV